MSWTLAPAVPATGGEELGFLVQWKKAGQSYSITERNAWVANDRTSHRIVNLAPGTRYDVKVLSIYEFFGTMV